LLHSIIGVASELTVYQFSSAVVELLYHTLRFVSVIKNIFYSLFRGFGNLVLLLIHHEKFTLVQSNNKAS